MSRLLALAAAVVVVLAAGAASARPTYFENLRVVYAIPEDSRIDACGVCHKLWTGTGARNAFGTAVEQELYTGKSIVESLHAVEGLDSDGDGYLNVDELMTYLTLPGYNCDTFGEAIDAPLDYHTYITPLVDTCLPALDILPSLGSVSFLTETGARESQDVTILNYGATDVLHVASYGLAPGASPALSVSGPPAPLDLAPGTSVTLTITFAPATTNLVTTALQVVSNDPETPTLDVGISAIGFVKNLAPADDRAACRKAIDDAYRKYSQVALDAWTRCATDESRGIVCRRGKRDQEIARAETKFRRSVGGDRDKKCAGASIGPSRLDYPAVCGGSCGHLRVTTIPGLATCLLCRHGDVVSRTLAALVGTEPPDLPATTAASSAAGKCIGKVGDRFERAVDRTYKALAACALDDVTADTGTDCAAAEADTLAAAASDVNDAFGACADTTGLTACPLVGEMPDPACLGTEAVAAGTTLTDAVYAVPE